MDLDNSSERPRPQITVEPLREEDLPIVKEILETWMRYSDTNQIARDEVEEAVAGIREFLAGQKERKYFVAKDQSGTVIGTVGMAPPDDKIKAFATTTNPIELINLYTSSKHRFKGVGTALVDKIEEEARSKGHTEIVVNSGPRHETSGWPFYDRQERFQHVGFAKDYYGEGASAKVWRVDLSAKA